MHQHMAQQESAESTSLLRLMGQDLHQHVVLGLAQLLQGPMGQETIALTSLLVCVCVNSETAQQATISLISGHSATPPLVLSALLLVQLSVELSQSGAPWML